ncbi:MAG: hypothetical protein ACYC1M_18085 [Armatimonadota bacterium]
MDRKQKMTLSAVGIGVVFLGAAAIQFGTNQLPPKAYAQGGAGPSIPGGGPMVMPGSNGPAVPGGGATSMPGATGPGVPGAGQPGVLAGGMGMGMPAAPAGQKSAAPAAAAGSPCSQYAPCTPTETAKRPKSYRKDPFKLMSWEVLGSNTNNAWTNLTELNQYRLRIQPDEAALLQTKQQQQAADASSQVEIPALKGRMVGVMLDQPVAAIIEIDRGTMIVHAGDMVEGRYRVLRIEPQRVVLIPTEGKRYEMNLNFENATSTGTNRNTGGTTMPSMPIGPGSMTMPGVPTMPRMPGR